MLKRARGIEAKSVHLLFSCPLWGVSRGWFFGCAVRWFRVAWSWTVICKPSQEWALVYLTRSSFSAACWWLHSVVASQSQEILEADILCISFEVTEVYSFYVLFDIWMPARSALIPTTALRVRCEWSVSSRRIRAVKLVYECIVTLPRAFRCPCRRGVKRLDSTPTWERKITNETEHFIVAFSVKEGCVNVRRERATAVYCCVPSTLVVFAWQGTVRRKWLLFCFRLLLIFCI